MAVPVSSNDAFWTSPAAFVGSLCVHAVIAWLIVTNMNSCGRQGDFGTSEQFREVGLYVQQTETDTEEPMEELTQPTETLPDLPDNLNETLTESPQAMPALPDLPSMPLIGPGPPPASSLRDNPAEAFANSMPPPPPTAAGIPSTTSFFEIDTIGRSLVYLIDCSGSMSKHNAFRHAKNELNASLERLDPNLKFQVVFYNDTLFEFRDRKGDIDIHWATATNLTRARGYIAQMDNSGGTSHFPALMKALSYSPEVIFFLTDAAEPELSARQLAEIERKNNGRAAIHCIEFGLGPSINVDNFLNRLARQNGGTYRYRDMTQLGP